MSRVSFDVVTARPSGAVLGVKRGLRRPCGATRSTSSRRVSYQLVSGAAARSRVRGSLLPMLLLWSDAPGSSVRRALVPTVGIKSRSTSLQSASPFKVSASSARRVGDEASVAAPRAIGGARCGRAPAPPGGTGGLAAESHGSERPQQYLYLTSLPQLQRSFRPSRSGSAMPRSKFMTPHRPSARRRSRAGSPSGGRAYTNR